MAYENFVGKRFGKLTVLERVDGKGKTKFRVRCECGREKIVLADNLKRGMTTSCGVCFRYGKEFAAARI